MRCEKAPARHKAFSTYDVGLGALYFFASHMVIRAAYYLGSGRDERQAVCFLLCVLVAVALTHVCWRRMLKLRLAATEYTGMPLISLLAGVGAMLSLIAIIPQTGYPCLFLGALFVGLAVGGFSVVLTSSVCPSAPAPHLFRVPSALLVAVGFYFAFRFASTVSDVVGEGFLSALPLVTVACTAKAGPQDNPDAAADDSRSLQVLSWVAAAFAVLGTIATWLSATSLVTVESAINYRALSEALAVLVMLGCCRVLHGLASQRVLPKGTKRFVPLLMVLPPLLAGCITAADFAPSSSGSLLWESSFWVLIVAIFAYDMKATPYSVDGVGLGPMFEAMAVGQVAGQLLKTPIVNAWVNAGIVALLVGCYLFGMISQFAGAIPKQQSVILQHPVTAPRNVDGTESCATDIAQTSASPLDGVASMDCHALAERFGLTEREESILDLLAQGRSANYIADTLCISFNTVRTHIRHVYEKLGVHSKQELIDTVRQDRQS